MSKPCDDCKSFVYHDGAYHCTQNDFWVIEKSSMERCEWYEELDPDIDFDVFGELQ